MRGLSYITESAMEGFSKLDSIVESFAKKNLISSENSSMIRSSISTLRSYYKNEYYHNLDFTSEVSSHCVSHGLSCADNELFSVSCDSHTHKSSCQFCNCLEETLQVIQGLLDNENAFTLFSRKEIYIFLSDLRESAQAIYKYVQHIQQTFLSNYEFQNLLDEKRIDRCWVTADWMVVKSCDHKIVLLSFFELCFSFLN